MQLNNLEELPRLIFDRMRLDEHVDFNIDIIQKYQLNDNQRKTLLLTKNDGLLKKYSIRDISKIIQDKVGLAQEIAQNFSTELLGGYFLLFQDFLGKVDDLIVQNSGDLQKYQERAKKLLSPHRQLQEFIKPYLYDFGLENGGDVISDELIDIILDRALGKIDEKGLIEKLQALTVKAKTEIKAEEIADVIENLLVAGDISKRWADYYANLADNVLAGRPFVEEKEEEKKEEAREESVILEKSEERPREKLSALEIQERLKNLSLETDLTKKIIGAKELLDGLNIYAMKKSQIYDTISQAEKLTEHLVKAQSSLEKRAVEDELRGIIDKIVLDIKEAAAEPASAEEIQNALREIL